MTLRIDYATYDQLIQELTRIDHLDQRYYRKEAHDPRERLAYYQRLERRRTVIDRIVAIRCRPVTKSRVQ